MILSRRRAIHVLGAAASMSAFRPNLAAVGTLMQPAGVSVAPGPFEGTRASLQSYTVPNWFVGAKFGIWSHWGPQSAIGDWDWYAKALYVEGSSQYKYHLKRFGTTASLTWS